MGDTPDKFTEDEHEEETVLDNFRDTYSADAEDPLLGKVIDKKYLIEQRLGVGGMGAVYKGKHQLMERTVAIKILHSHLAVGVERGEFLERFRREALTASKLKHPGAITIHDFGVDQELPYIIMEFNSGVSLKSLLENKGALKVNTILHIMHPVCGALSAAHEIGIVHRDLKPDNIMVSKDEFGKRHVQVLDFGIAKLVNPELTEGQDMTMTGTLLGTPYYMSPEQIRCETLDARSDIYALGVMLYKMFSGELPFAGQSRTEVLMKHLTEEPPPLNFSKETIADKAIASVVMKALEKDPKNRQQTVAQLFDELKCAVEEGTPAVLKKEAVSNSKNYLKFALPLIILSAFFVFGSDVFQAPAGKEKALEAPSIEVPKELDAKKQRMKILWHRLRSKREEVRATLEAKNSELQAVEKQLNDAAGFPNEDLRKQLEELKIDKVVAQRHRDLHEENIFADSKITLIEKKELVVDDQIAQSKFELASNLLEDIEEEILELLSAQNTLISLASNMHEALNGEQDFLDFAKSKKINPDKAQTEAQVIVEQIKSDLESKMFSNASQNYIELTEFYSGEIENIKTAQKKAKESKRRTATRSATSEDKLGLKSTVDAGGRFAGLGAIVELSLVFLRID